MNDYLLLVKSVSSTNFKILFELLKDIFTNKNINLIFNKEFMKIKEIDNKKKVLVHLEINKDIFQYFHCESELKVGVSPESLFKIIKTATSNDTISFIIHKNDPDTFIIRFENSTKNKVFESSLKLLNIYVPDISIPDISYDYSVTLESSEFQNTCKILNSLGDIDVNVDITKTGNQLIFTHLGQFSQQKIIYIVDSDESSNIPIQGIYNLQFLLLFSKSSKINKNVTLYLSNDVQPLIIEYAVTESGTLRFLITREN